MKLRAVLVEDDRQQLEFTVEILQSAGFEVLTFTDASSALESAPSWEQPTDLCVLDRRLPRVQGEEPLDQNGDELLDAILEQWPDMALVVFTGHTDVAHAQWAMRNRGSIEMRNGEITIDRVAHFEKGQSIEFEQHVQEIAALLSSLDDIELLGDAEQEESSLIRRMLRRAGVEYAATSITATRLEGGATGSPVWICRASGQAGQIASVVLKRVKKRQQPGGLQALLPAALTAGNLQTISGFCSGGYISVLQLAGPEPTSLLGLIRTNPGAAATHLASLKRHLDVIESGPTVSRTLSEIAEPFASWELVTKLLDEAGIAVPAGTRYATASSDPQHGDLHAGNVLIVNEGLCIIDFDSQVRASRLVDPVANLLGPLFHLNSHLRAELWPTPEQCSDLLGAVFLEDCPAPDFFRIAQEWVQERKASERELWTVMLSFAARQMDFKDVKSDPLALARARSICSLAVTRIDAT